MAGELKTPSDFTGINVYAVLRNGTGQVWNTDTPGFEDETPANVANYEVALSETATGTYFYVGDLPAGAEATRGIQYKIRDGANAALTDQMIATDDRTPTLILAAIEALNDPTASAIATAVRNNLATELARIDATISSRSTYAGGDTPGTTTLLARLTATRAGYLDNLSAGAVATASKLLKYVQLLFRKDAAIATDNATELTEINANGGSGAGGVDNTTDSQQAIADNAGGGGGDCPTAEEIGDEIVSRLAGQQVSVISPVQTNGFIRLIKNFDYKHADGRALSFADTTWPTLTSGSVRFDMIDINTGTKVIDSLAGTVSSASACRFDIDQTDTDDLTIGKRYRYQVEATLASGNVVGLQQGEVEIVKNISD